MATSSISAASATGTSGIDVNALVSQLMTVEQIPITKLANQTASYQAKLSAFGAIQGAIAGFQATAGSLANATRFQTVSATASDTTMMSASALTSALPGSYSIEVTSLAQSQKLVAAGQASVSTTIGTGVPTTLTFDFGTITGTATAGKYAAGATFTSAGGGVKTVTIDSSNNTLQGIRDAINAAKIGVTASLISDGSASPYRLVLSSDNMGKANSLKISATGDATVSGLLANDPTAGATTGALGQNLTESVTAQNANLLVNGIAVSKNSNTVTDVIPGVSLNLTKVTTPTVPVTLTVAQDTASVAKAVGDFVTAFNALNKSLKDATSYNAATKKGAILQGDATVRNLQAQLRSVLDTQAVGAGGLTSLMQIGVAFQRDGSLALDSTKLNTALLTNFKDVAGLFAATGAASDGLVTFKAFGTATKPGNYALNLTQIATQGNVTGTAAPASLTVTAGTNDTLAMSVNGISTSITLTAKTYATVQDLALEVQSKLNGVTALSSAGIAVTAAIIAGNLSITSNSYGATSSVTATGGNGLANLFGTATSTAGLDIAGTINGIAATGNGQVLTAGSGDALGLSVTVNGGALGARGTISYSQGYAYNLNNLATTALASNGAFTASTNQINNSIKNLADRTATLQQRLIGTEARYRAQFTALDKMLNNMNTTSSFLTQQLSRMA